MNKQVIVQKKLGRESCYISGVRIDSSTYKKATDRAKCLAEKNKGAFICIGNAHVLVEASKEPEFKKMVNSAELITSDGISLVWALKLFGARNAQRVTGTALTFYACEMAQACSIPVGFYGGKKETLALLVEQIKAKFPSLNIAYVFSPPFRDLSEGEDIKIIRDIKESGAKILFVGLGCPKQEKWAASHKNKIPVVTITVGAAFDFIAGIIKRAPEWMQSLGLEWFFRLIQEPRRLWKRYLVTNSIFSCLLFNELIKSFTKRRPLRENL